ncbi:hypothetical protein WAI88_21695, partial [Acinetobacter baumannii]
TKEIECQAMKTQEIEAGCGKAREIKTFAVFLKSTHSSAVNGQFEAITKVYENNTKMSRDFFACLFEFRAENY